MILLIRCIQCGQTFLLVMYASATGNEKSLFVGIYNIPFVHFYLVLMLH